MYGEQSLFCEYKSMKQFKRFKTKTKMTKKYEEQAHPSTGLVMF